MMIRPTLLAARYILTGFTSGLTWRYRALVAELSLATVQCTVAALEAKVAELERKLETAVGGEADIADVGEAPPHQRSTCALADELLQRIEEE